MQSEKLSAAHSVRQAHQALEAVAALLATPGPAADPDQVVSDALAALEAARTARRHISLTIEAIMALLTEAGVPWPYLGINGPGDD